MGMAATSTRLWTDKVGHVATAINLDNNHHDEKKCLRRQHHDPDLDRAVSTGYSSSHPGFDTT